jgi:hypothetical protein
MTKHSNFTSVRLRIPGLRRWGGRRRPVPRLRPRLA